MFGLFGKKTLENSSFNNMLIAALGEAVGKSGRLPTEGELTQSMTSLLTTAKASLNENQINSIRACAITSTMSSFSDELVPLLKQFKKEMPRGEIYAYNKIKEFLITYTVIFDDDVMGFLKKFK